MDVIAEPHDSAIPEDVRVVGDRPRPAVRSTIELLRRASKPFLGILLS